MKLNLITLATVPILVVVFAMRAGEIQWTPMRVAGVAIAALSMAMLVTARLQLGGSFSVRAKAHKLVTTGIYSRLRNPIYVSGALFLVGLTLFSGRWWLLCFMVVLIPLQAYRARKEARVLEAAFGEEYRQYRASTWF